MIICKIPHIAFETYVLIHIFYQNKNPTIDKSPHPINKEKLYTNQKIPYKSNYL